MTPHRRVQLVIKRWWQSLGLGLEDPDLAALEQAIIAELEAAVDSEREACAAVVEEYLSCRIYHPRGIPAAIRERGRRSDQAEAPAAAATQQAVQQ